MGPFVNMNQYLKISGMEQKWNMRKTGALTAMDKLRMGVAPAVDSQTTKAGVYEKVKKLKEKLKTGGRLSLEEKEFLRQNTPEVYKKVEEAERERDAHAARLRACKTKEEAEGVKAQKNAEITASMADKNGDLDFVEIRTAQTNAAANEVNIASKPSRRELMEDKKHKKEERAETIRECEIFENKALKNANMLKAQKVSGVDKNEPKYDVPARARNAYEKSIEEKFLEMSKYKAKA